MAAIATRAAPPGAAAAGAATGLHIRARRETGTTSSAGVLANITASKIGAANKGHKTVAPKGAVPPHRTAPGGTPPATSHKSTPPSSTPPSSTPHSSTPPSTAPHNTGPPPTARPSTYPGLPYSKSYVLVDVNTGNVLLGHNERMRLPPASLTKILTALIAIRYLPSDAGVPGTVVSENVYPNKVGMEVGVAWPLTEVLQSLLVLSANDAAYAIAQRVSGSLSAFSDVMERSAQQIGMADDPVFHDPAGLDGTEGFDGGNLVSARDLAIAARDLLYTPQLAKIVRERNYRFVDPKGVVHWLPSMNFAFLVTYPGAIGVKTGFTDRAGVCIIGAATRGGRTMLAVVMNGYNPTQSAVDLLNEGFATPTSAEPATDHLPPHTLPSPPKIITPTKLLRKVHCTPVTALLHAQANCRPDGLKADGLAGKPGRALPARRAS